jgi:amino acid transporter
MNTEVQHKKALKQRDLVLFSVSAILLLDTLAAGAAAGPPVIFWWLLFGLIFFIPNALMTAELGCAFPEQGGIYAWVRDAFGPRWSARVTWSYWVNITVWLPAIYILFAGVFSQLFVPDLSLAWQITIGIVLSWMTVLVNVVALDIGKWVPNIGALIKVLIFSVIVVGGLVHGLTGETANDFTLAAMQPRWGDTIQYLPVLVYGMLGFELISAGSDEMKDPARDVPRAILISGLIIIIAYTAATAAILVAIPAADIDLVEGLMDTLYFLLGDSAFGRAFAVALGIGALYSFFSNGVTWALGGNRAIAEAAMAGEMPAFLGLESKHNGTPVGAAVVLGIASTIILLIYGMLAGSNEELFWDLFAFSAVLFLLPYVGMSLAFLKLRKMYPEKLRPFRVPGGMLVARVMAWTCIIILCLAIALFCYVPGEGMSWPVFGGSIALMIIGEGFIRWQEGKKAAP